MYREQVEDITHIAQKKLKLLHNGRGKYLVSAAMAGMYVGLGIVLIYIIGGYLNEAYPAITKTVMGLSFGIALSLVMMAGAELFTGNNMIMAIGGLEKTNTWGDALRIWVYSYIGNFIGALLVAVLVRFSGLMDGHAGEFFIHSAAAKMNPPFIQIFLRGILCNVLVCLSTWCSYKLKNEAARILMICMCLFAFITSGYEHSVANMTLLSLSLMLPGAAGAVSVAGMVHNLLASTLGNFVGGAVLIGAAYWYVSLPAKHKAK